MAYRIVERTKRLVGLEDAEPLTFASLRAALDRPASAPRPTGQRSGIVDAWLAQRRAMADQSAALAQD